MKPFLVAFELKKLPVPAVLEGMDLDRVRTGRQAALMFRALCLQYPDRESAFALIMEGTGGLVAVHHLGLGTEDTTPAGQRELIRAVIAAGGSHVILGHYHPSRSLAPSNADTDLYMQLRRTCRNMGITLLDSMIVSRDSGKAYSMYGQELIDLDENLVDKN